MPTSLVRSAGIHVCESTSFQVQATSCPDRVSVIQISSSRNWQTVSPRTVHCSLEELHFARDSLDRIHHHQVDVEERREAGESWEQSTCDQSPHLKLPPDEAPVQDDSLWTDVQVHRDQQAQHGAHDELADRGEAAKQFLW